jgi:predicted outer membrane repeat protein
MRRESCWVSQVLAATVVLLLSSEALVAAIIEVPADYVRIQEAIDAAVDGDEILVAPGVYSELINLRGKRLHLLGSAGPEETIIDGAGLDGSIITCTSGETEETVIEGFTLANGIGRSWLGGDDRAGGAIDAWSGSPSFVSCVFTQCTARFGAVALAEPDFGSMSFAHCSFIDNTETAHALIYEGKALSFDDCLFRRNSSGIVPGFRAAVQIRDCVFEENGCGVRLNLRGSAIVERCVFRNNHGCALSCEDACLSVVDSTFHDNNITANSTYLVRAYSGSISLDRCQFMRNRSINWGGAIVSFNSRITASDCAFTANESSDQGGAVFMSSSEDPLYPTDHGSLYLYGCYFEANGARDGGALSVVGQTNWDCEVTAFDCRFVDNNATVDGGAMHVTGCSSLGAYHCSFLQNSAGSEGGGCWLQTDGRWRDCSFRENRAEYGGAIFADGQFWTPYWVVDLLGCSLERNHADLTGGAIYAQQSTLRMHNSQVLGNSSASFAGGIACTGGEGGAELANTLLLGNTAGQGGGALLAAETTDLIVANSVIVGNKAPSGSALLLYNAPRAMLMNTIVASNPGSNFDFVDGDAMPVVRYCLVEGGYDGVGNIDADPLFVRSPSVGPDGLWGTGDDDYGNLRLQAGSPAIDAGDNEAVALDLFDLDDDGDFSEPLPFDLNGDDRFVDDPASDDTGNPGAPGPLVDMGAYEHPGFNACTAADLDGSGRVDQTDLGILLAAYYLTDAGDVDGDGDTDRRDLAILLAHYEEECR